jgi:hypothetical protein
METKTDKPKTQLRMIFNDDCAVIDFLCDLQDREPLHSLQRFINSDGEKTMCLLYDVPKDGLILVILYMAPFRFNEGDNKLTLYAHPDMQVIMKHFKTQWDATPPETPEYEALMDIVNFLYNENYKRYDKRRRDLPV